MIFVPQQHSLLCYICFVNVITHHVSFTSCLQSSTNNLILKRGILYDIIKKLSHYINVSSFNLSYFYTCYRDGGKGDWIIGDTKNTQETLKYVYKFVDV